MSKPALVARGHLGIGDCIHQRAALRELMKTHEVWLEPAYYVSMYHDLVEQGLHLRKRIGPYTLGLDPGMTADQGTSLPRMFERRSINYDTFQIRQHGSIIAAQFAVAGLPVPVRPDFSLPVPAEWRARARALIGEHRRPLLIYRPIVASGVWHRPMRWPDPSTYRALFNSIRDRFYCVSVAYLAHSRGEELIGPDTTCDHHLMHGELDFATMAGLFAEADLVFGNPGFAPVIAQAVGTPVVCVYGGNESSLTTQRMGMHLAPTLAIEPDRPCDCHDPRHACDKHITLDPALARLGSFVEQCVPSCSPRPTSTALTEPASLITG